ncbi:MAG: DUF3298 domain-containing protein [Bacteroidales bacterium]|nr:DUF3298 domain-containing protein [Bacteroidales bacterium]
MKRIAIIIALAALLLASCKHGTKEFTTYTVSGERCYLQIFDDPYLFDMDTIGAKITYSIVWPEEGLMSMDAIRELQYHYFYDSTVSDIADAPDYWLDPNGIDGWFFYPDETAKVLSVDSIDEERGYSYIILESSCKQDSNLAVFTIYQETYPFGAAHGLHSTDFLTVDIETGNAIHITDLVTDTNLLCEAIAHAIYDLDVNQSTRECLFDEFVDVERMPMPNNFTIDSARNGIIVYYGLYELTCYACGIQEVTLPIFWLSKHVPLTPYAKRLFGPGSYIE